MVQPRAAARRQRILLSSDDEGPSPPPPKRPRRGALAGSSTDVQSKVVPTRAQTRRAASPEPASAASAQRSPTKSPGKRKAIHTPITSFFRPGPAARPLAVQPAPTPSPEKRPTPLDDVDDILASSDDGDRRPQPPPALPVRKRKSASATAPGPSDSSSAPKGSQRFLHAASGARSTPTPSQPPRRDAVDGRPWTEQYGPVSLDELAVHKKKVSDVRTWLEDVYSGRQRKRLLLLKGPAGSGKTTTMALLSKELGIHMHEWRNPVSSMTASEGVVSATAQFEDFVGRAGAFGSLDFDQPQQALSQAAPSTDSRQKQLVLVEEFPNTFARASPAVQAFRSSVLNFLAATTPSATTFFAKQAGSDTPVTPIIMIISETLLSTSTAAADSFTAHRLLGPEILTHPGVSVIDFNPIAPTYMTKALDLIVVKEARKSARRNTVGPQVIQRLAELGDIRSAVSSLEFLCLRGDASDGWGAKVNFSKKKGPKDIPITKMERESLELVTQRESTLGIFHAVGRVVYNKRLPEDPNHPVPQPPHSFPERRRPKASEVNLDTLIDELGTDTNTFTAALHENYVLSCGGADSEETMDSVDGCIEALSDADLLSPDRFGAGSGRRNLQGTSADTLRQDEMCFQTSVRGLLYNLPHPVKRMAPPPGVMGIKAKGQGAAPPKPGSPFVMYYPASLRLWKQQEETAGLLELWISRAQRGALLSPGAGSLTPALPSTGVESWSRSTPLSQIPTPTSTTPAHSSDAPPPALLGSGASARAEMLLERLPYLPAILLTSRSRSPSTAAMVREVQRLTAFHGSGRTSTDADGEETLQQGEPAPWATDGDAPVARRRGGRIVESKDEESAIAGLAAKGASLVLEDDDIED